MVTIVTVVFNDACNIRETLKSVIEQNYNDKEYIVIDGGSKDGTMDVVSEYSNYIDNIVSEPDRGIYDAMNKAIDIAKGEWIIFMNSGDKFTNSNVLSNIFQEEIQQDIDFMYSDFCVQTSHGLKSFTASYEKGILLHQSVIYKRKLHNLYGKYIVTSKYIVSDYIFFLSIPLKSVKKIDFPISINSEAGVSGANWCGYQKICVDYMFSRLSINCLVFKLIERIVKNKVKSVLALFKIAK